MKKTVLIIAIALFTVKALTAQTPDKLTNSTIVKMVKANLSDEIIIDEITNSNVDFNLSQESISALSGEHVSNQIIQAMKTTSEKQKTAISIPIAGNENKMPVQATTVLEKDTVSQPAATVVMVSGNEAIMQSAVPIKDTLKQSIGIVAEVKTELPKESIPAARPQPEIIEKTILTMDAVSYVIPLEDMIIFFNNEFSSLLNTIQGYDQRIRDTLNHIQQLKEILAQTEKELSLKKNADAKGFSSEIYNLKKNITEYRGEYKQIKTNMFVDGMNIVKELKTISNEKNSSISSKFKEVSSVVKSANPDPSKGRNVKSIEVIKQKFNGDIISYVACVTEIPVFFQNEITLIQAVVIQWNAKANDILQKDNELSKQLEPLNKKMADLKQEEKKNKKNISELKKQYSAIKKQRKQLGNQMVTDSKELAEYLKQLNKEAQATLGERFIDIIENVNFLYQDKF